VNGLDLDGVGHGGVSDLHVCVASHNHEDSRPLSVQPPNATMAASGSSLPEQVDPPEG
jgi:hypothetical protein